MKKLSLEYKEQIWNLSYEIKFCDYLDKKTLFYLGEETLTRKKYIFFGEEVTYKKPKFAFELYLDIESATYSKEDIRNYICKKLDLVIRKKEIENAEII